jgi:hypothetical protein
LVIHNKGGAMKNKILILFALILFGCSSTEKDRTDLGMGKEPQIKYFQGVNAPLPHYVDGYDRLGYDKDGYDKQGYDKQGYDKEGYNKEGYNLFGYNKNGDNIVAGNLKKEAERASKIDNAGMLRILSDIENETNKIRDMKQYSDETQEAVMARKEQSFEKFITKYKRFYLYEVPKRSFSYSSSSGELILNLDEVDLGKREYSKEYSGVSSWGDRANISSVLVESKKFEFLNKAPVKLKLGKVSEENLKVRVLIKLLNDEDVFEKTTVMSAGKAGGNTEYYTEVSILRGIACYVEVMSGNRVEQTKNIIKMTEFSKNRIIDMAGNSKKYRYYFNKIGEKVRMWDKNLVFVEQNEIYNKTKEKVQYLGLFDLSSKTVVLEPRYTDIGVFNERYAYVEQTDRFSGRKLFGLFDIADKKLSLDAGYTGIGGFDKKYLQIEKVPADGSYGAIGLFDMVGGTVALKPMYSSFRRAGKNYIIVKKMIVPGEYTEGVFRISDNKIVIEPVYEEVSYGKSRKGEYFKCKKKGKDEKIFLN